MTNVLYITSAFSVSSVKTGFTQDDVAEIAVKVSALEAFATNQLAKMIKSLDSDSSASHKDSKDKLLPMLVKLINELDVEEVKVATSQARAPRAPKESSGPSRKTTCYTVFEKFNLFDKDSSKVALAEAMNACGMEEDDVKGKRVIQSYMSYYRNDIKASQANTPEAE